MPKKCYDPLPVLEADLQLFVYLKDHSYKEASPYFGKTEGALRSWKNRAVIRLEACQNHINRINNLRQRSPRVRHMTSSPRIKREGVEEEEQVE